MYKYHSKRRMIFVPLLFELVLKQPYILSSFETKNKRKKQSKNKM